MTINIAAFSGSLRKDSYTTKLVKAFQANAPDGVQVTIVDISGLPLMNEDLESNPPQSVLDLHKRIASADGILVASPEYNRSYTPAIKNALDWGSRPAGQNKWDGKPTAIVGCSPYSLGGFGAVHHLRQVAVYLNMPIVQQPEFYLSQAAEKFNEQGELVDAATRELIGNLWKALINLIPESYK